MMTTIPKNNKVLLGLSGGVDSTAAALLLKEKGYEVTGLFFDVLGSQQTEKEEASRAARELGIDFIYKNVKDDFHKHIISYFCESYVKGETPNPCVMCNPRVKFRIMAETADEIGAYYLATGHYARIVYDETLGRFCAAQGSSQKKDQSYMLYRLDQSILSRLIFPLGEILEKEETRGLVRESGIYNADKKDSQEICFIKQGSYMDYIQKEGYRSTPGAFVDQSGNVMGQHQGLLHYTVGQRKGLGVTFGRPTFVIGLDPLKNQVILGNDQDLFNRTVQAENIRLVCHDDGIGPVPEDWEGKMVFAKIRYAAAPAKAILHSSGHMGFRLVFDKPQRASTPGQSVVFYEGDLLRGGGFITNKREL